MVLSIRIAVESTLPTSTTNITGFLAIQRGSSLRNASTSAWAMISVFQRLFFSSMMVRFRIVQMQCQNQLINLLGAPGLDFQTWDTMNSGCPTLAATLFLPLGWETTNQPLEQHPRVQLQVLQNRSQAQRREE